MISKFVRGGGGVGEAGNLRRNLCRHHSTPYWWLSRGHFWDSRSSAAVGQPSAELGPASSPPPCVRCRGGALEAGPSSDEPRGSCECARTFREREVSCSSYFCSSSEVVGPFGPLWRDEAWLVWGWRERESGPYIIIAQYVMQWSTHVKTLILLFLSCTYMYIHSSR